MKNSGEDTSTPMTTNFGAKIRKIALAARAAGYFREKHPGITLDPMTPSAFEASFAKKAQRLLCQRLRRLFKATTSCIAAGSSESKVGFGPVRSCSEKHEMISIGYRSKITLLSRPSRI